MKNLYIKSFAAIFGMSVLAGCGENSWNDHLDGFEEPPIYSKTEAITYRSYKFKIGGLDATLYGNVYNLFDNYFVKDATTDYNVKGTWPNAYKVFYSFGRTFSLRLKVNF